MGMTTAMPCNKKRISARKKKASPLDVKGVKFRVSAADLVVIVRKGREPGSMASGSYSRAAFVDSHSPQNAR
jgi:hypothetical protein